jgi:hypothetical protein
MMKQNMSSPSPVTDGRTVWVMTGTGVLKAFDCRQELWVRHSAQMGRFGLQWDTARSLPHEDGLVRAGPARDAHEGSSYVLRIDATGDRAVSGRSTRARFESPDASHAGALETGQRRSSYRRRRGHRT